MPALDLYFVRHGLAGEHGTYANDAERPLTEEGAKKTRQIAQRLLTLDVRFDRVLTSPLVRAQQTAKILIDVGLAKHLEESTHLAPGGDINVWLEWLQAHAELEHTSLALVGHEPSLSEWAETLIWGEPRGILVLKKAGIIGLTLPEKGSSIGNSSLFWLTPPRYLIE